MLEFIDSPLAQLLALAISRKGLLLRYKIVNLADSYVELVHTLVSILGHVHPVRMAGEQVFQGFGPNMPDYAV